MMMGAKRQLALAMALISVASILVPEPAFAQVAPETDSSWLRFLQSAVIWTDSPAAQLIAAVAIVATGISWMVGLIGLRCAGCIVLGLCLVFGATPMVPPISAHPRAAIFLDEVRP